MNGKLTSHRCPSTCTGMLLCLWSLFLEKVRTIGACFCSHFCYFATVSHYSLLLCPCDCVLFVSSLSCQFKKNLLSRYARHCIQCLNVLFCTCIMCTLCVSVVVITFLFPCSLFSSSFILHSSMILFSTALYLYGLLFL